MPPILAAFVFLGFSFWLCRRDAKVFKSSSAMWFPVAWACIIACKPVSYWLGTGSMGENGYEDRLIDKGLFAFLIVAGLIVLRSRRFNWQRFMSANKWLIIFFVYLGISILWSDDPVSAFKRWTKDVGNIVMVLVVITDQDPMRAVRTFFARCIYLLLPLSVLVVKYFPAVSRFYDRWTYQVLNTGISGDKNVFGLTLFICMVALCWLFLEFRAESRKDSTTTFLYLLLAVMGVWLLDKARSSTATVCTIFGVSLVIGTRYNLIRSQVKRLGIYAICGALLVVTLQAVGLWDVLFEGFTSVTGRDPTLHGRTEIWSILLKEDINPLLGAGYYSFWSVERNRRISEKYYYSLGEAHNGYLETYLNSGLVGLFLLVVLLLKSTRRIKEEVFAGSRYGALCLAFMMSAMLYGISEAIFNRLNLLWFVVILASIDSARAFAPEVSKEVLKTRFQNRGVRPIQA